jgi:hypothetical protein
MEYGAWGKYCMDKAAAVGAVLNSPLARNAPIPLNLNKNRNFIRKRCI